MHRGERLNAATHLLGLLLAIPAGIWLLLQTWPTGSPLKRMVALVFVLSVVGLYAASTMCHSTRGPRQAWWARLDHAGIFVLIAGTVTPFALLTVGGGFGWCVTIAAWGMAFLGVRQMLRASEGEPPLKLYLGFGWCAAIAAIPAMWSLPWQGALLLGAGILIYTAGTFFYLNRPGYRHGHGVWHLFVLAGTMSHFWAVAGYAVCVEQGAEVAAQRAPVVGAVSRPATNTALKVARSAEGHPATLFGKGHAR
ncbi:PAQR family membrane homeostasis protein TrhA [Roseateles amylovorans]|uniref:Hemolysin III family protein n=1 Tax=Roseateles amylovorans TaxID=2978473 RepID=A0ABY6ASZ3_9BURK|nr:hemolysin III family protein [Roseateles amylovorans]UXH76043.1 hemolysin III family protein [Roseateles amylovorans]